MSVSDERIRGAVVVALRDAIVQTLESLWPHGPVQVFKHRGKWTHRSLDRYFSSAPCIAVTWNGGDGFEATDGNGTLGVMSFTAFVITVDDPVHADDDSIALTEVVTATASGAQWGLDNVASAAMHVHAVNAYDHELDDKGCNIAAVSWDHELTLDKLSAEDLAALPDFLRAHTTMRVGDPSEDDDVADETVLTTVRE